MSNSEDAVMQIGKPHFQDGWILQKSADTGYNEL